MYSFHLVDLKEAYIADSESSSIRALDLKTGGSRLLAGGDPIFSDNLFKALFYPLKVYNLALYMQKVNIFVNFTLLFVAVWRQ